MVKVKRNVTGDSTQAMKREKGSHDRPETASWIPDDATAICANAAMLSEWEEHTVGLLSIRATLVLTYAEDRTFLQAV